jgi:Porphobilinogen deaminase, dipyromethane cofactor binding domain
MSGSANRPLVIGSRASKLAQVQTDIVKDALSAQFPDQKFQIQLMTTEGDKNQAQALYLMDGKGLWTKELEVGLLDGSIDLIVHSLKDVPTTLPEGCAIGAILEREDPRDALVVKEGLEYKTLEELPAGSIIGTSSVRRVAQLKRSFPKLEFRDVVRTYFYINFVYFMYLHHWFPSARQFVGRCFCSQAAMTHGLTEILDLPSLMPQMVLTPRSFSPLPDFSALDPGIESHPSSAHQPYSRRLVKLLLE